MGHSQTPLPTHLAGPTHPLRQDRDTARDGTSRGGPFRYPQSNPQSPVAHGSAPNVWQRQSARPSLPLSRPLSSPPSPLTMPKRTESAAIHSAWGWRFPFGEPGGVQPGSRNLRRLPLSQEGGGCGNRRRTPKRPRRPILQAEGLFVGCLCHMLIPEGHCGAPLREAPPRGAVDPRP